MQTRAEFRSAARHRIRFLYTPQHTSWLNHIELWCSILVRRVLKRGNFNYPPAESVQFLAEGKIDAFLAFPPVAQELRAKQIGHVVVDTSSDRPWSQYFCCVATGNREFVQKHPVATKRALRALLKATDVCALAPEQVAQSMVDKGFTPSYGYALQVLKDLPYNVWREYDPEDSVRFFALRLHEAGMIKSSPQKLIA